MSKMIRWTVLAASLMAFPACGGDKAPKNPCETMCGDTCDMRCGVGNTTSVSCIDGCNCMCTDGGALP
jgi:hypothetical protein